MKRKGKLKIRRTYLVQARREWQGQYQKAYIKDNGNEAHTYTSKDAATRYYTLEAAQNKADELQRTYKKMQFIALEGPYETI